MIKKQLLYLSLFLASSCLPITAEASDGLGKTLNMFYGTDNISFGGLSYSGNGGGTIPQIEIRGNDQIGDFYIGHSVSLAFGKIDGIKADRYALNIKPGWIFPITSNLAVVPYARLAGVLQDSYVGSLRNPSEAKLKFGYNIGGGVALQWSPISRLVVTPSADASYYRQGYDSYNNNTDTNTTSYISTTEYREQLGIYYYLTDWLNIGVHVGADQFGTGGTSLVSYGAGLGIDW